VSRWRSPPILLNSLLSLAVPACGAEGADGADLFSSSEEVITNRPRLLVVRPSWEPDIDAKLAKHCSPQPAAKGLGGVGPILSPDSAISSYLSKLCQQGCRKSRPLSLFSH
jgi:hypothetical protein